MPIFSPPSPTEAGRDLGAPAHDAHLSKPLSDANLSKPLSDARLSAVVEAAYILREVSR